jgi:glycosyltransferase involved in cell wall biosynthesis
MTVSVCFTNFGPYHLARLRALADRLDQRRDRLVAYEIAGSEQTYPWARRQGDEPFEWVTLFPDCALETIEPDGCRRAMIAALDRDRPDVVGIVGYARPESMAAARWARWHDRPTILMSESQEIDRPRAWWKELIKRWRIQLFDVALVGGPSHRAYLVRLGMPADRIALGYNAVDNAFFASAAQRWRQHLQGRAGLPEAPFFLTVSRFVPEKNLVGLIEAYAQYRCRTKESEAWHLVLCGDGPGRPEVEAAVAASGLGEAIHRPGFLQVDALPRWYAHAGAFVLASLSEPWGLVANEAAASSLPLLISDRAGCATTLVPEPAGTTGAQFDPLDVEALAAKLRWMADRPENQRAAMGRRAARTVSDWGPDRFARGVTEAIDLALAHRCGRIRLRLRRPRPMISTKVR